MDIKRAVSTIFGGDEEQAPDALTLIHSDHREVDELFAKALDEDTPAAQRRATVAKIVQALTVHAQMEESLFYPALRKAGGEDERDSVLEAAEEHGVVKDLIARIEALPPRDETLEAKVTVLKELVHHHVKEEESQIFSEARRALGQERLQQLGEEMQRFKERAMRSKAGPNTAAEAAAERGTPSAKPVSRIAPAKNGAKKAAARKSSAKKSAARTRR
jgi:hemerythrin superfamily protein